VWREAGPAARHHAPRRLVRPPVRLAGLDGDSVHTRRSVGPGPRASPVPLYHHLSLLSRNGGDLARARRFAAPAPTASGRPAPPGRARPGPRVPRSFLGPLACPSARENGYHLRAKCCRVEGAFSLPLLRGARSDPRRGEYDPDSPAIESKLSACHPLPRVFRRADTMVMPPRPTTPPRWCAPCPTTATATRPSTGAAGDPGAEATPRTHRVPPLRDSLGILEPGTRRHALGSRSDLSWSPDTLVQPDCFAVPTEEGRTLEWRQMKTLLLVVEILSPGTAAPTASPSAGSTSSSGFRSMDRGSGREPGGGMDTQGGVPGGGDGGAGVAAGGATEACVIQLDALFQPV